MNTINDPVLIRQYVKAHRLDSIFSTDLSQVASITHYAPREFVYRAGKRAQILSILVEGECLAYVVNSVGKIHSELHYTGLNIMGLIAVLWDEPVVNDIMALTDCTFLTIQVQPFRDILLNDVKFLNYAVRYLANHIRKNHNHFEPLNVRLAAFILKESHDGIFNQNLMLCADILETSYRHLLRMLAQFCDDGILERPGKRGIYRIASQEKLMEMMEK